jgi:RecB family exonuclease
VGTEVEFVFSVDGTNDYMMKGIADRIDHDGKGNYEIHDYKS